MPPTTRRARALSAIAHVFALPEMWAIVAEHSGVVGAWRLTGVCKAAREGAKVWLRTLPGLVVCGGVTTSGRLLMSEVWRLDLGKLQWERMPSLARGRSAHACCAVRGGVAVLGGMVLGQEGRHERTASVEILGCDSVAAITLAPCSPLAAPHEARLRILAALGNDKIAPRLLPFFSDATRFLFSVTKTLLLPSQNHN
jgi:hypothetical protein